MSGEKNLNDDIINWTLAWWCSQIGGGQNGNATTPQVHPNLPRCYYVNTHWFTKLQKEGVTKELLKWTKKSNLDQDYDLMLVPVNISKHHWYLAVIDFKNKYTVTYDSYESKATWNTTTPAMQKTHSTLMMWLQERHEDIYKTPFPVEDWKHMSSFTCMGHTPQQGTPSNTGVKVGNDY